MKIDITYVSNIESNRVDAEISYKCCYKWHWDIAAIIHISKGEYIIEHIDNQNNMDISVYIEEAKKGLLEYVNNEGSDFEEGETRAGHALKLMLKKDGTAMGANLGENETT